MEIRGRDARELLENALFAFYDQVAQPAEFEPRRELTIEAAGGRLEDALRALLAEALFYFDTEGFVAVGAEVSPADGGRVTARLWGENADCARHTLLREVKAVTYHRLAASRSAEGFTATVLLDL